MSEHTTDAANAAQHYRASIRASSDRSLKATLARLIVVGVERGLIRVDPESSLAFAETITAPPQELRQGASWEEHQARSAHPWFEEYATIQDLQFALKLGEMQEVAVRALGSPLEDLGVYDQMLAMALVRDLSPIATGCAPRAVVLRMRDTLTSFAKAVEGLKTWESALKNAFPLLKTFGDDKRPEDQVQFILDLLRASTVELPAPFLRPREAQLVEATRILEGFSAEKRTGPAKQHWSMARDFAAAFGVHMPERERDAKPRKVP